MLPSTLSKSSRLLSLAGTGVLCLGLAGLPPAVLAGSCGHEPAPQAAGGQGRQDIVQTAVAVGKFKTLAATLQAAGLVETLQGPGPFTVFAPTDEAFAKLPAGTLEDLLKPENKAKLTQILTYHVVPGKAMAKDVAGLSSAKTVNGKELPLKAADGKVQVGNATVVKADVAASNGVIHVIDTVLLP